ncbi:hypothetical protein FIBSPDRAFT_904608 [Athelia psychrophila]|uniref:Uncharacterized protein n=1 Tax=Athelia psychrophila TaxID=1759441 RepID=A0A167UIL7_9AGAM|nr:hypothetical protein FIBSPDRAFT_904608 [Fibularhizoctonia sp. CBS 109695]
MTKFEPVKGCSCSLSLSSRKNEVGRNALLDVGPKLEGIRAAARDLWKLCLDVASGDHMTRLLEEYVTKYGGPLSYKLNPESAAWFLHDIDERTSDAMDVDSLDPPTPPAIDNDLQCLVTPPKPP